MLKENVDYELVPSDEDEAWSVRILTGDYTETVIQFGAIRLNGEDFEDDATQMTFNFQVISTPDDSVTEENVGLQSFAGDILLSVLESAIKNDELVTEAVDDN